MSIKRLLLPMLLVLALFAVACGSDDDDEGSSGSGSERASEESGTPASGGEGGKVKIAFSAPGADHGWMAAITENARKEAEKLGDVELIASEGVTDSAAQADQIETLIAQKPDALVMLPNEGDALTPVAQKATAAGIPVVDDRPRVRDARRVPHVHHRRQLRHRLPGGQRTSPTSSSARATSSRSRASPASR